MAVKSYKLGASDAPSFPPSFEVLQHELLQLTDFVGSVCSNKFYSLELHRAGGAYRIYTHYGRTGEDGTHECRFFEGDRAAAEKELARISREKVKKGYKPLSVANVKVGSTAVRGQSVGVVDAATKALAVEAAAAAAPKAAPKRVAVELDSGTRDLVRTLFAESTGALLKAADTKITAQGVETPLGVLTLGQVEHGEAKLKEILEVVKKYGGATSAEDRLRALSSEFFSIIPHRIPRSRDGFIASVIRDLSNIAEKQETLTLMRDMLSVSAKDASTLASDDVEQKYVALGAKLRQLQGDEERAIAKKVIDSQHRKQIARIHRVFAVERPGEAEAFERVLGNVIAGYHGSKAGRWMGILSRGILLPKVVQTMGVSRTDYGWLGSGCYYGSEADTPVQYTGPAKTGRRYLCVAEVAAGKQAKFTRITPGLSAPPAGFDSCWGVRGGGSQFADNEIVIYRTTQARITHLIEF